MKTMLKITILAVMALIIAGAVGCGKKSMSDLPPGATKESMTAEEKQRLMAESEARAQAERLRRDEEELARQRALIEEEEAALKQAYEQSLEQIQTMIHFDFDSYELKPDARDILQAKAQLLKDNPNLNIVVEGYCDNRGTEEYNLALGERRARSAYEFLVLLGVAPERINIVSYGEENPLDPANNEVAWAKNRRDQFRIVQ